MAAIGGNYSDYLESISAGKLSTHQVVILNAYSTTMTTTDTVFNPLNLTTLQFPTTAAQIKISSTNANDTSAGTGLRTVLVSGLDSNYEQLSETVTLNGQTAVLTTNSFIRINKLTGVTAGSSGAPAGTVYAGTGTVTAGVPATIYCYQLAADNTSHILMYTVPAGFRFYISNAHIGHGNNTPTANVILASHTRLFGGMWVTGQRGVLHSKQAIVYAPYITLDEKTDLKITLRDGVSASSARVLVSGYLRNKSLEI